jgi:excisionase family DNA binding protein
MAVRGFGSVVRESADEPEFLTVSQIAKRLSMSSQAVRDWIEEGLLPGIRVRKVWRVPRAEFERLLASLDAGPPTLSGGWEEKTPRRGFVDPEEASER